MIEKINFTICCMLILQLQKLKFFLISERELFEFIITSSCERVRTGGDWCEFMTDNLASCRKGFRHLLCTNVSQFVIAPDAGFLFMSAYGL